MNWQLSNRCDPITRAIADRHYNRQKPGSKGFVPPGRCLVLRSVGAPDAFWVTSYPFAEYVLHQWAGAFVCSAFRNENPARFLSSDLIREACAITAAKWPIPDLGMITFIDPKKVRRKRDFGRCYRRAGFEEVGATKGGLVAEQLTREKFPAPLVLPTDQLSLGVC